MVDNISLYLTFSENLDCFPQIIDSILDSCKLAEIIIVEDGTRFSYRDSYINRIKFIFNQNKQGIATARNIAILSASSKFIACLDSDCLPDKDWLENLSKYMKEPKVAGVGGMVVEINNQERADYWRSVHMTQHWGDEFVINPPFLFGANGLYRKEALLDVGLYNEKYQTNYEDVDISRRLKQRGWKLVYTPEARVYHLRSDSLNSLLRNFWRWNFNFYEEEKQLYQNMDSIISKLYYNFGRGYDFIKEDFKENRFRLLYIDFILPLVLSIFDFSFILDQCEMREIFIKPDKLASVISLFEFCYQRHTNNNLSSTLLKKNYAKEQNLILFLIQIGKSLKERTDLLWEKVIKDLCLLIWNGEDVKYYREMLLKQINSNYSFDAFIKNNYGHLVTVWLDTFFNKFNDFIGWLDRDDKKTIEILNV